jgi:hypothetical protein
MFFLIALALLLDLIVKYPPGFMLPGGTSLLSALLVSEIQDLNADEVL